MVLLCKHFAFPLQLNSPPVGHKKHKIFCYTVWGKNFIFEGCQTKKLRLHDKEGKGNVGFSIVSLRVYSDISGWVKLKFLKQLPAFPGLSLAREDESHRKQLRGPTVYTPGY